MKEITELKKNWWCEDKENNLQNKWKLKKKRWFCGKWKEECEVKVWKQNVIQEIKSTKYWFRRVG